MCILLNKEELELIIKLNGNPSMPTQHESDLINVITAKLLNTPDMHSLLNRIHSNELTKLQAHEILVRSLLTFNNVVIH